MPLSVVSEASDILHFTCQSGISLSCSEQRSFENFALHVFFFYKKLGSAPSTKSFLISHENFAIIVLKVSYLVSYFRKLNCLIVWMLGISGWR